MGLHDTLLAVRPGADLDLIGRAYEVAARCHRGQLRKSGDPYISHPVMVATIMAGLGADDPTLCAAILHDTVEDTPFTPTALRREFGAEVSSLVAEHNPRRCGRPGRSWTSSHRRRRSSGCPRSAANCRRSPLPR